MNSPQLEVSHTKTGRKNKERPQGAQKRNHVQKNKSHVNETRFFFAFNEKNGFNQHRLLRAAGGGLEISSLHQQLSAVSLLKDRELDICFRS